MDLPDFVRGLATEQLGAEELLLDQWVFSGVTHGIGYPLSFGVARELCWLTPRSAGGRSQDLLDLDGHCAS